ncbi:MAG: WG repeat-containing protein [Muribaculaceae bacterium]|nr:WG repeat-containing protein [Muribaculaceae bacterium]
MRLFLTIASVMLLVACSHTPDDAEQIMTSVTSYPARLPGHKLWGMADGSGKFLIADAFESMPTAATDGIFAVYTDTGISIYAISGPGSYKAIRSGVRYAGAFAEGVAPIAPADGPIEVIDTNGDTVFTLSDIDGHNFTACLAFYSCGVLPVREIGTELWGAINTSGQLAVQPRYETLTQFSSGYAIGTRHEHDGIPVTVIIAADGTERARIPQDYTVTGSMFSHGLIALRHKDTRRCAVADTRGRITELPPEAVRLGASVTDGVSFMGSSHRWGIMNTDGGVMVKAEYFGIHPLDCNPRIWCERPGGITVMYTDGIEPKALDGYSTIAYIPSQQVYIATNTAGSTVHLFDKDFNRIPDVEYAEASLRLSLSDIILSDRAEDHPEFNTSRPDEDYPSWMEHEEESESDYEPVMPAQ